MSLKSHKIITLEEFHRQDYIPEMEFSCDRHSSKTVEVFCLDHDKLCCSVCFATEHRTCRDVQSLEDISAQMSPTEDADLLRKLTEIIQDTEKLQKENYQRNRKLNRQSNEIVDSTVRQFEKAKQLLYKRLDVFIRTHQWEVQQHREEERIIVSLLTQNRVKVRRNAPQ
jgi:hypothetical protein